MHLPALAPANPPAAPSGDALRQKAEELETAFLAEMLGHAGLGTSAGTFAGGPGEEQFASFLRSEQARAIARQGGIGLAELIFRSLVEGEHVASA
jgi:Rod binding domain-containing protein